MKAVLINPKEKSIEVIEISSLEDIARIIGYATIISDDIDGNGDKLFFDEECFLRGTEGRFQIDALIPVSGNGIILGSNNSGELFNVKTSINKLNERIKFL